MKLELTKFTGSPEETRGRRRGPLRRAITDLAAGEALAVRGVTQFNACGTCREVSREFPTRRFTTRQIPDGSLNIYRTH